MQTQLLPEYQRSALGQEAESILRACVHCGFCTATCPTYQLLGDELDGPRGRIYQIKQVLEGASINRATQEHLDRCLTCRSCETTCPSGVRYGRLLEIGREFLEQKIARPAHERVMRWLLRQILPRPTRFAILLRIGQTLRPLLPGAIQRKIPARQHTQTAPRETLARKMLLLEGCVQSSATPQTNIAARRVFAKLGVQLTSAAEAGCCGAVSQHLSASEEAKHQICRNIDTWWPEIENGAEAIVITASGCGVQVKDYGHILKDDPTYADKAARVAELAKDVSEAFEPLLDARLAQHPLNKKPHKTITFHCPCTLQHGQQLNGSVERILEKLGYALPTITDSHLCCGSAGTYSLLQPELSQQLLKNKLKNLEAEDPDEIVTANIGCQMHLASGTERPVKHWIELVEAQLA
jgi:glycolate oxidase iron-sulfur subunit